METESSGKVSDFWRVAYRVETSSAGRRRLECIRTPNLLIRRQVRPVHSGRSPFAGVWPWSMNHGPDQQVLSHTGTWQSAAVHRGLSGEFALSCDTLVTPRCKCSPGRVGPSPRPAYGGMTDLGLPRNLTGHHPHRRRVPSSGRCARGQLASRSPRRGQTGSLHPGGGTALPARGPGQGPGDRRAAVTDGTGRLSRGSQGGGPCPLASSVSAVIVRP